MTPDWLTEWRASALAAIEALLGSFHERYGFAPGEHTVGPPATPEELTTLINSGAPPALVELCAEVGGVSLPDVGNGYFISPPRRLAHEMSHTYRLEHSPDTRVALFASDGGGRLYALPLHAPGPVYRLQDAVLGPDMAKARIVEPVADDVHSFLQQLLAAIQTFASTGTLVDL